VFAETLGNSQHSVLRIPQSRSCTPNYCRENLSARLVYSSRPDGWTYDILTLMRNILMSLLWRNWHLFCVGASCLEVFNVIVITINLLRDYCYYYYYYYYYYQHYILTIRLLTTVWFSRRLGELLPFVVQFVPACVYVRVYHTRCPFQTSHTSTNHCENIVKAK
jgi:hypothetical protein